MVGARILTGQDQQLRIVDVVQGHARLADPDRLLQGDTRRLMTHVRVIRQVVGAVRPNEQLIDKSRLVRRATGGLDEGLVWVPKVLI